MANVTDKLRRGAPAFSTTLSATKAAGAASATLASATGVPTDTAVDFTVGRVDASGNKTPALKAVYKATLSGSTISNLTIVEGTDQSHAAGTPVEITFTAATWNDMVTWGLTQHNQNGTHAAVTATSVTTTGAVTVGSGLTVSAGTVTLPAGSAAATALTNPYKFSCYNTTAPTLPNSTWTKVPLDTKEFDTNSNYDNVTNFRFTAPVAGFYQFNACVKIGTVGISTSANAVGALYKNGTGWKYGLQSAGTGNSLTLNVSQITVLTQLAANDYIELYAYCGEAGRTIGNGQGATYMSGFLVSTT